MPPSESPRTTGPAAPGFPPSPGLANLIPRFANLIAPAAGALALAVYLPTMNRTFGVVDCGELAACAWTLGIPHPTGYPTLMLLGWVVTHLAPLRPVLALNVLAAVLTASSVVALTFLFDRVLGAAFTAVGQPRAAGRRAGPESPVTRRLLAALAALFTGLAGAWWAQAVEFEVYCLQAVLLPLVCWLFLRYVDEESGREAAATPRAPARIGFSRRGFVFALVLGLALTSHATTGLLGPAFLWHYFRSLLTARGERRPASGRGAAWGRAFRRWLYLAPPFLAGIVPLCLWMMARAAAHPRFDWGAPSTPEALIRHLGGWEYRHAMGNLFDRAFLDQLAYFGHWLPGAVGYLGLGTGLVGLIILWRRSRRLTAWSGTIFVVGLLAACSYNVNDVSNYFMSAVMVVGAWTAVAAEQARARFGGRVAVALLVALVVTTGALNWRENDERRNTVTEDFTFNMLDALPRGAIVLTQQWDFWEAGSFYLQEVEGFRKDVVVIDVNNLHADWYVDQLARAHPEVMATVRPEAERVKQGARRVRRGEVETEAQVADYVGAFNALVNAIVDRNIATRPCFLTYDPFDSRIAPGYYRVPWRLAQRLTQDPGYLAVEFPRYRFRMWRERVVPQVVWTLKLYAEACQNRAQYEHAAGRDDAARRYAELALAFDPGLRERDVPALPNRMAAQIVAELRRFVQAREDLREGRFPSWY